MAVSSAHATRLEGERSESEGGADTEAYADRAYPDSEISAAEVQGALKADARLKTKLPKLGSRWESLGPDTLDVDRLGTQSFIKPTQWSGRVTALTMSPTTCNETDCAIYVGAAGGGV